MEKIDFRGLPDAVLNERRRRAVKLRESGISVRQTARPGRVESCLGQKDVDYAAQVALFRAGSIGRWSAN